MQNQNFNKSAVHVSSFKRSAAERFGNYSVNIVDLDGEEQLFSIDSKQTQSSLFMNHIYCVLFMDNTCII